MRLEVAGHDTAGDLWIRGQLIAGVLQRAINIWRSARVRDDQLIVPLKLHIVYIIYIKKNVYMNKNPKE